MNDCKTGKCGCIKSNSYDFDNKMIDHLESKSTNLNNEEDPEDYIDIPIPIKYSDSNNSTVAYTNSALDELKPKISEMCTIIDARLRSFDGGAIRDTNIGKLEYYGFLSPLVLKRYSEYMNKHRTLPDGGLRGSDNWKSLFGKDHNKICFDSLLRHLMDVWLIMDGYSDEAREPLEEALCAMSFNINALLLKILKDKKQDKPEGI